MRCEVKNQKNTAKNAISKTHPPYQLAVSPYTVPRKSISEDPLTAPNRRTPQTKEQGK